MTILHIAHVGEDRFAGVNVAVPAQIRAQSWVAQTGFLNLANVPVPGVSAFPYEKGMTLSSLPAPFCAPELVVFHEIYRPPFLALARECRRRRIPYVIIPHGGLTAAAQRIKAYKKIPANFLLFGRFIRGAAAVQCLSDREMAETKFRVPMFIGSNGIDLEGRKTAFSETGLRFTYIGRLDCHIKGLDLLMEALGQERERLLAHRCRVDLYGPDVASTQEALLALIGKYRLESIVAIHPPVSGEEKHRVLSETDCYIQTSRSEGLSMGILEALGWGIPCLVTRGTGMAALMEDSDAGWGCETDAAAIAAALERAVSERADLPRKSGNARALVEANFTWERVAEQTVAHYRRLVAERNG